MLEILKARREKDDRRWDGLMGTHRLDGQELAAWGLVMDSKPSEAVHMGLQSVGYDLSDWTEPKDFIKMIFPSFFKIT